METANKSQEFLTPISNNHETHPFVEVARQLFDRIGMPDGDGVRSLTINSNQSLTVQQKEGQTNIVVTSINPISTQCIWYDAKTKGMTLTLTGYPDAIKDIVIKTPDTITKYLSKIVSQIPAPTDDIANLRRGLRTLGAINSQQTFSPATSKNRDRGNVVVDTRRSTTPVSKTDTSSTTTRRYEGRQVKEIERRVGVAQDYKGMENNWRDVRRQEQVTNWISGTEIGDMKKAAAKLQDGDEKENLKAEIQAKKEELKTSYGTDRIKRTSATIIERQKWQADAVNDVVEAVKDIPDSSTPPSKEIRLAKNLASSREHLGWTEESLDYWGDTKRREQSRNWTPGTEIGDMKKAAAKLQDGEEKEKLKAEIKAKQQKLKNDGKTEAIKKTEAIINTRKKWVKDARKEVDEDTKALLNGGK